LRLLLLSTPVGPLGSGLGGGVELTVVNLANVLVQFGHHVTVVTPAGESDDGPQVGDLCDAFRLVRVPGALQMTAQHQGRCAPVVTSAVLANIWDYARQQQPHYDLLVNFAYDWLPFFLTPFFDRPIAHFVSMGSVSDAVDAAIAQVSERFPGTLGAYTRSQAETFLADSADIAWQILGSGLNMAQYDYCDKPDDVLAWVGRIAPEKGVEDAIAAARLSQQPLKIFGKVEDCRYWQAVQSKIDWTEAAAPVEYCGFLPTDQLQKVLGRARALLMTSKWIEAFGMVVIEAMACGVPVIAYARGGPAEIVQSGKTGWLVAPDSVKDVVGAIAKIDQIDRARCRQQTEAQYGLHPWGRRFERWFEQIIAAHLNALR